MEMESYQFADLNSREDLLKDLRVLEERMKRELEQDIALIAYAHNARPAKDK